MFSPDGTLISASAALHCGARKKWRISKRIRLNVERTKYLIAGEALMAML